MAIESTYTKLFSSIVTSSIWAEDDQTRIVWITLLALKNKFGQVSGSIPGLARIANVPVEACRKAIERLSAPDPDSRTKDADGRRISEIEGGWQILNHDKYRKAMSRDERQAYRREWMRRKREEERGSCEQVCEQNEHIQIQRQIQIKGDTTKSYGTHDRIRAEKELERVERAIRGLETSVDPHRELSREDNAELKRLRTRKSELMAIIGYAV